MNNHHISYDTNAITKLGQTGIKTNQRFLGWLIFSFYFRFLGTTQLFTALALVYETCNFHGIWKQREKPVTQSPSVLFTEGSDEATECSSRLQPPVPTCTSCSIYRWNMTCRCPLHPVNPGSQCRLQRYQDRSLQLQMMSLNQTQ